MFSFHLLRTLPLWLGLCFCISAVTAQADEPKYPVDEITITCAFAEGGDTDFNTRLMAKYLEEELKVPVKVENVMGNNGLFAMDMFNSSAPTDGSAFLVTNSSAMTFNYLSGYCNYNHDSFTPAAVFGKGCGEAVLVRADSPYRTLRDLADAAANHPDTITLAITLGGGSYILGQVLEQKFNAKFKLLDGGDTVTRMSAIRDKRADAAVANYKVAKPYIDSGDLRALAIANDSPLPGIDVPTISESGIPGFSTELVYVLLAPKGTNPAALEQLNAAIRKISETNQDYIRQSEDYNFQPPYALTLPESYDLLRSKDKRAEQYRKYL